MNDIEANGPEVTCPHCGYEYSDSWEFPDEAVEECNGCKKTFNYRRNISVDYTSWATGYQCGKCRKVIPEEEALATTLRAARVLASGWKKAEEALDYCNDCYYALIKPYVHEIMELKQE